MNYQSRNTQYILINNLMAHFINFKSLHLAAGPPTELLPWALQMLGVQKIQSSYEKRFLQRELEYGVIGALLKCNPPVIRVLGHTVYLLLPW